MIFHKLKLRGYKAAFLLDASYHSKTLYYLDRSGYYTVGGVPLWYNARKVNFAVPISDDSIVMQLFLYRTVVLIRKHVEEQRYYSLLNY